MLHSAFFFFKWATSLKGQETLAFNCSKIKTIPSILKYWKWYFIKQIKDKCKTSKYGVCLICVITGWLTVCVDLHRFPAKVMHSTVSSIPFFFLKKISPCSFICLPVDTHHSLHINHQSVAPFSPPPGLNLFTFLSFPFLYRESRLIRRSLDLIFIKGSGEGGDSVMTIIFHIRSRDKG